MFNTTPYASGVQERVQKRFPNVFPLTNRVTLLLCNRSMQKRFMKVFATPERVTWWLCNKYKQKRFINVFALTIDGVVQEVQEKRFINVFTPPKIFGGLKNIKLISLHSSQLKYDLNKNLFENFKFNEIRK